MQMFSVHQKQRENSLSTKYSRGLCFETLKKSQGETSNCLSIRGMIF